MFKANNMRMFLVLSVALFVLCSSVNMVPARSFLDDIKRYSKRQGDEPILCDNFQCSTGSNNLRCQTIPTNGPLPPCGLYHNISYIIYSAKFTSYY